jgi:hypothetical protein
MAGAVTAEGDPNSGFACLTSDALVQHLAVRKRRIDVAWRDKLYFVYHSVSACKHRERLQRVPLDHRNFPRSTMRNT